MRNTSTAAPLVFAAIVIATIAGITGWMLHARTAADQGASVPESAVQPGEASVDTGAEALSEPSARWQPSTTLPATAASPEQMLAVLQANDASATQVAAAGELKLRTRYEAERVDARWASSKQATLERLSVSPQIEQLGAEPLGITAQCRTTVCRIEADFASRLAAEDWFTLYTLNAGPEMANVSSRATLHPDGTVRLQLYGLARQ